MNRSSIRWCFLVVLVWSASLRGQQSRVESRASGKVRVVEFGRDSEIRQTAVTKKYVGMLVGSKESAGNSIDVFDRDGNALFRNGTSGNEYIEEVELSDSLNYVMKIDMRYGPYDYQRSAVAYDIKTGREIWRIKLPSHEGSVYDYRISPDGMRMINSGESAPCPILNLTDGSEVRFRSISDVVGADWLDNERIVIAIQQSKLNPEIVPLAKKAKARRAEVDSLRYALERTLIEFEERKISKEQCEIDTAKMIGRIDSLRLERLKDRNSHVPSMLPAAAKLMVYNIRTSEIEEQKDLYAPEGEPILVSAGGSGVGIVNVEAATGNIFVYAEEGDHLPFTRCLIKLDKQLNRIVFARLPRGPLFRLNIDESIHFVIQKDRINYLLDNNTGKVISATKLVTKHGDFDLDLDPLWLTTRTFVPGMNIRNRMGIVEFSVVKEGRQ